MNIGECPYEDCDEVLVLEMPEKTPAFAPITCDGCGRVVWYRFSRVDPEAWTEEGFLENYEIDSVSKTVTRRKQGAL